MEKMNTTLELPADLFQQLQELADLQQTDPVTVISRLIAVAHQQQTWLQNLEALREDIRLSGGLAIGTTRGAVIEQLRQTRRDLFEAEYAHLYR